MFGDGRYSDIEDCIANGNHLECIDQDGFCNGCGYHAEDDVDEDQRASGSEI